MPDDFQWLLGHIPSYREWYRFWLFYRAPRRCGRSPRSTRTWPDQSRSVSELNDMMRQQLTEAIEAQYEDRPDLLSKVVPQYPPASKRIIVDNGAWATMLHRDNVTLTDTGIAKIVPEGVVTTDGTLHEFDVLIYGTGFQPSRFLTPMKVVGQRRRRPARHVGRRRPRLPRHHRAGVPQLLHPLRAEHEHRRQRQHHLVLRVRGALRARRACGRRSPAVTGRSPCAQDVHDTYNEEVDAENLRMVWGVSTVSSWYKNANGRVAQNWPFPLLEFWKRTKAVDEADYESV